MPQLMSGNIQKVSGITCHEIKEPVGIVGCIVPFNFPVMVPLWTIPISLVAGNCNFKPSEKTPLSMTYIAKLFKGWCTRWRISNNKWR